MKINILLLAALLGGLTQCKKPTTEQAMTTTKISLAEWSIHKALKAGTLKADDFPRIAKEEYGISAVEYVNQFYVEHGTDTAYWKWLKARTDSLGVTNVLIMVDNEGDLGNPDPAERQKSVENHFKWVDAAAILGCHSIRVNAFGAGTKEEVKANLVDAMKKLCTYAAAKNINVIIENHGLFSSDGKWVTDVIAEVNMPNAGTLPDFGNWCTAVQWGSTEKSKNCAEAYDRYQGVSEFMPFAKGVSAKTYAFDAQGNETVMDYARLAGVVKQHKFDGFVGIEYEGDELSEHDGILATKRLIERYWQP